MTGYGNNNQKQTPFQAYANVPPRGNETALMIEGLYNGLSYDLQKMKKELMNELKYNALQASSLYQAVQKETGSATETNAQTAQSMVRELKYGYQQNQMIYESLSGILTDDVLTKLETVEGKVEVLEEIDKALAEIKEKLDELASRTETDYTARSRKCCPRRKKSITKRSAKPSAKKRKRASPSITRKFSMPSPLSP